MNEQYVGDGVYLSEDPNWSAQLILKTEGNTIYLDPYVQEVLVRVLTKVIKTRKEGVTRDEH